MALSTNPDFQKDQTELIRLYYAHVYKHRFLFTQSDKKALTEIFSRMNAVAAYLQRLDLFSEMDRKDVATKACELWDIDLPDDRFRLDFDF